jgi:hypothetical protein
MTRQFLETKCNGPDRIKQNEDKKASFGAYFRAPTVDDTHTNDKHADDHSVEVNCNLSTKII